MKKLFIFSVLIISFQASSVTNMNQSSRSSHEIDISLLMKLNEEFKEGEPVSYTHLTLPTNREV